MKLCQRIDKAGSINRAITAQLLRAGTSVGANLAEGRSAQSRADFVHKLSISTKEANETYYWLRLLVACDIVAGADVEGLLDEANQIIAVTTAIARNAKRNGER